MLKVFHSLVLLPHLTRLIQHLSNLAQNCFLLPILLLQLENLHKCCYTDLLVLLHALLLVHEYIVPAEYVGNLLLQLRNPLLPTLHLVVLLLQQVPGWWGNISQSWFETEHCYQTCLPTWYAWSLGYEATPCWTFLKLSIATSNFLTILTSLVPGLRCNTLLNFFETDHCHQTFF